MRVPPAPMPTGVAVVDSLRENPERMLPIGEVATRLGRPKKAIYQIPRHELPYHRPPDRHGNPGRTTRWQAAVVASYIERHMHLATRRGIGPGIDMVREITEAFRYSVAHFYHEPTERITLDEPMPVAWAQWLLGYRREQMWPLKPFVRHGHVRARDVLAYVLEFM